MLSFQIQIAFTCHVQQFNLHINTINFMIRLKSIDWTRQSVCSICLLYSIPQFPVFSYYITKLQFIVTNIIHFLQPIHFNPLAEKKKVIVTKIKNSIILKVCNFKVVDSKKQESERWNSIWILQNRI